MRGILIGLALALCRPLTALLMLPLAALIGGAAWLLLLPGALVFAAVLAGAIAGQRWPAWLLTPDDDYILRAGHPDRPPHFGAYEPTVRAVYARFGRIAGDVYWLAWRNALAGLAYRFRPALFRGLTDVSHLSRGWIERGPLTLYTAAGYTLWQIRAGRVELLAGWMVRGIVLDPLTLRRPINNEGRPLVSLRRAG